MPSGRRYIMPLSRTNRYSKSFIPSPIKLLNVDNSLFKWLLYSLSPCIDSSFIYLFIYLCMWIWWLSVFCFFFKVCTYVCVYMYSHMYGGKAANELPFLGLIKYSELNWTDVVLSWVNLFWGLDENMQPFNHFWTFSLSVVTLLLGNVQWMRVRRPDVWKRTWIWEGTESEITPAAAFVYSLFLQFSYLFLEDGKVCRATLIRSVSSI